MYEGRPGSEPARVQNIGKRTSYPQNSEVIDGSSAPNGADRSHQSCSAASVPGMIDLRGTCVRTSPLPVCVVPDIALTEALRGKTVEGGGCHQTWPTAWRSVCGATCDEPHTERIDRQSDTGIEPSPSSFITPRLSNRQLLHQMERPTLPCKLGRLS